MAKQRITKAVFPVAGMGTRFLPFTKATPKEMMPIVDKPLIQFAVDEAIAAGITEIIFIIGRNRRSLEDHFDKAYEIETKLELRGKNDLLRIVQSTLPKNISYIYIRQPEALGLGHAVLCARSVIGDDPFAVLLADDLIESEHPVIQQMIALYEKNLCSLLAVENIKPEDTSRYGIIKCGSGGKELHTITGIVEKPKPENAPSTLGVVGRYILTSKIFDHLEQIKPGYEGEIQLTDGIASLLKEEPMLAYEFSGTRYDCGTKFGYLKATIELALKHPEVGREFSNYLATKI